MVEKVTTLEPKAAIGKILEELPKRSKACRQIVPWLLMYPNKLNSEIQHLAGVKVSLRTMTRYRDLAQIPGRQGALPQKSANIQKPVNSQFEKIASSGAKQ
jgi:hypothetical protein